MIKYWPIVKRHFPLTTLGIAMAALPFSIAVCHTALILFIVAWVVEGRWAGKISAVKKNIILQLIIAFAVLQLIGIAYTENAADGWAVLGKKTFFFVVPVALATTATKFDEKQLRMLFYLFVFACFAGTLICLAHALVQTKLFLDGNLLPEQMNYLGILDVSGLSPLQQTPWLFFSYIGLSEGIGMHPSYLSLYLAFCIFFLLHDVLKEGAHSPLRKVLLASLIFWFTVLIVCLSSRIIILTVSVAYLFIAGYWMLNRRLVAGISCIAALVIVVSVVMYVNPVSRYRNLQELAATSFNIREKYNYTTSAEIRVSLWWLAWKSYARTNAWIGAGTGDVLPMMKETSEAYEITNILNTYDPHNTYLYVLIANGVAGLTVFTLCLVLPLMHALVNRDYLGAGFCFLFISLSMTESALELQKGIVCFAIVCPLLVFHRRRFQPGIITTRFFSAGS